MHVALYARVSTTKQAQNDLSLPDQLSQMREWSKTNNHIVVAKYVEPGASATDDKRPIFQQMISDAMAKPATFDAIIIHSLSRFFRDGISFGVYERKLAKNGVKVISITQPTGEDSAGEMMRRIICMFDEHQSKETSKHTSRAMRENAKQGYFNGSRAPFGYFPKLTDVSASRGRKKKKLAILDEEAELVRMIYRYYTQGLEGRTCGVKEIAKHLTAKGLLMRGKPWTTQKVHTILANTLYMGDYYFNILDSKARQNRPPSEWVKTPIPPIVDAAMFEQARSIRVSRAPQSDQVVPRVLSSPVLLAGIIKCGICGHRMTLSTGKSGTYRYYKCTRRNNQGNHACASRNLPMDKLDQIVIGQVLEKVLQPNRLQILMEELRHRIQTGKDSRQDKVSELERQLKNIEERKGRLLEAIESGVVDLDETTHSRSQQLKSAREALLIQIAQARVTSLPPAIEFLKPSQVDNFGKALRRLLQSQDSGLLKSYIQLLVDEVVVKDEEAVIRGSYAALAHTLHKIKMGTSHQVPTFIHDWRPQRDSNSCYRRERAMS